MLSATQSRQTNYTSANDKLSYTGSYNGPVVLRQIEGGVNYSFRPAYATRHKIQIAYKYAGVGDSVTKLAPKYFDDHSKKARYLELLYRLEVNRVDNWNYSLDGFKLVNNVVFRMGFEGIHYQAFTNTEMGFFRDLTHEFYSSMVVRTRITYPEVMPYYFTGGLGTQTDYVRGYEYYVIDGSSYGIVRFELRRALFSWSANLPVRYFTLVPLKVYAKIFTDGGYIKNSVLDYNFLSNRTLYSVGVGVDILTLYDVKVRVEYTRNHLNQNGLYLHFNSE